ncbi:glycosyltransferase [Glutamicibacter sp. Je.9.36]|uniref:glycosyltransferase n=1 Tax=Glutamicibacter sp. Je.9.36 TaxID=3142837 RepID=UPI003DAA2D5C
MDIRKLSKRLKLIDARIAELSTAQGYPPNYDIKAFIESRYYEEGLIGSHPFTGHARSEEEYSQRLEYFIDQKQSIIDQYKPIINQHSAVSQRWNDAFNIKIGIIADEFLYKSFSSTANFIPLTPENYKDYEDVLDLVLITSTWRGLSGEWVGASQPKSRKRHIIENELIPFYNSSGVPVAFYSKEDPPNYSVFIGTASLCDHIFTTAIEMVERYENDCPKALTVDVLPFSIDFKHHNPIGSRKHRIDDIVFAGSWHNHKYDARREAAVKIFDGVIASERELRIIDRNSGLNNPNYRFPEQYLPYIEAAIPHDELLKLHRSSDIVINLNSVVDSNTMYANRVVELQAMGCTVLSNYNAGVNNLFPNVYMPETPSDVMGILSSLGPTELYENQMFGLRNAYTNHVNFDRIRNLLSICGLVPEESNSRSVGILGEETAARRFMNSQLLGGFDRATKFSLVNSMNQARGENLDLVCAISKDYEYSETYLQDLINATKFVDADIVFKSANPNSSSHFDYSDEAIPTHGHLEWVESIHEKDAQKKFAIDNLGVSPSEKPRIHSYKSHKPILTVIVPVYNNGDHLRFKCFESLRRSSIFTDMEILLIDDGSTDDSTRTVVRDLADSFDNVSAFFFEVGGSGSASRPRNKGLELASSPWVTYLDPDNEAVSDGYADLVLLAKNNESNFAIGNMIRNGATKKLINYASVLLKRVHQNEVSPSTYSIDSGLLTKIKFTPMSIQALVANTQWLKSLPIEQPVGAVGQDSFFFQQMLYYANRISITRQPIHVYFAAVANSTVNSTGASFYKKYIPLERERSKWLDEIGLLEEYNSLRLEPFVKGWYLEKLKGVATGEVEECSQIIRQLVAFYNVEEWQDKELAEFFSVTSNK